LKYGEKADTIPSCKLLDQESNKYAEPIYFQNQQQQQQKKNQIVLFSFYGEKEQWELSLNTDQVVANRQ
jgi:hypothetical protein